MNKKQIDMSKEMFDFVQLDERIFDTKFETKPIGYMHDAWIRFKKNKASVTAAIIIICIILFSLVAPLISKYDVSDCDSVYVNRIARSSVLENVGIATGRNKRELNHKGYSFYMSIGIGAEDKDGTGATWAEGENNEFNPIYKTGSIHSSSGKDMVDVKIDAYLSIGFRYITVSKEGLAAIEKFEEETTLKILYPIIDEKAILNPDAVNKIYKFGMKNPGKERANYWYIHNENGDPLDENGVVINSFKLALYPNSNELPKLVSNYLYDEEGNVVFASAKDGDMYEIRVLYWNYYRYYNYMSDTYGKNFSYATGTDNEEDPTISNSVLKAYLDAPKTSFTLKGYTPEHLFGTDSQGYDIFVRLASGIRLSLILSVCVSVINLFIGAIYGAIEGYYGGAIDMVMERVADVISGIPFIVVATLFQQHLVATKKVSSFVALIFAFVLTGWISTAYRVRTQFYRFKGQEYILAARTLGAKDGRLMFKHIFPNTLGTLITSSVLIIPSVIFSESMLSYLGIANLQSSTMTSLGTMLSNGQSYMQDFPHLIFFPAIVISLLMISFNLFGNGLRDAFNPSLRGVEE